jgi:hypothetical protein
MDKKKSTVEKSRHSVFQPFLVRGTLQVFKKFGGTPNWLK